MRRVNADEARIALLAFKTCSPHTGIKTSTLCTARRGLDGPCLSKHVPRTRGLKQLDGLGGLLDGGPSVSQLSKHVPRTRGLKPVVGLKDGEQLGFPSAFKTCSPHTGIKTLALPSTLATLATLPCSSFKTCSPHTGIKTTVQSSRLHCSAHRSFKTFQNMFPAHGD